MGIIKGKNKIKKRTLGYRFLYNCILCDLQILAFLNERQEVDVYIFISLQHVQKQLCDNYDNVFELFNLYMPKATRYWHKNN